MFVFNVTKEDFKGVMSGLDSKSSGDEDFVNNLLVKMSAPVTIEYLTFLLNLLFNRGEFPQELKQQKFFPCTSRVQSWMTIITGLFHYLLFGARFLKKLCLIVYTVTWSGFLCFIINISDIETNSAIDALECN